MASTLAHLPVKTPDPAPDFTAGARILTEMGFDADLILWIFADTAIAGPLAGEMAAIRSEAEASRLILKAARR